MLIFAHRGASADAPENTLTAFAEAITQQADGIELDVFQHGDEFVVIHDQWLDRTTSGTGNIYQHSLQILQQFDAGEGQSIPTLKQVLALLHGRCQLNIEVKGIADTVCLVQHLELAVNEHGFKLEQLLVSSFNHHALQQLKKLKPAIKIGALTASNALSYATFAQELNADSVHVDVTVLDKAMIQDAHDRDLIVFAFTVDRAADIQLLKDWGVDGIFTNRPSYARKVINGLY